MGCVVTFPSTLLMLWAAFGLLALHGDVMAAEDPDQKWERKYEQILKERPEIRRKVESGNATKQLVIEWLKGGGERQEKANKYLAAKAEIEDPADFKPADEKAVYSGPQPGEKLLPLAVTGLTGERQGRRDGPGAYGLNRNVAMTVIAAKDGEVVHNFAFAQPMLYADPHVIGAVAEVIGENRQTVARWLSKLSDKYANKMNRDDDKDMAQRRLVFKERLGSLVKQGKITRDEAFELYSSAFPKH